MIRELYCLEMIDLKYCIWFFRNAKVIQVKHEFLFYNGLIQKLAHTIVYDLIKEITIFLLSSKILNS